MAKDKTRTNYSEYLKDKFVRTKIDWWEKNSPRATVIGSIAQFLISIIAIGLSFYSIVLTNQANNENSKVSENISSNLAIVSSNTNELVEKFELINQLWNENLKYQLELEKPELAFYTIDVDKIGFHLYLSNHGKRTVELLDGYVAVYQDGRVYLVTDLLKGKKIPTDKKFYFGTFAEKKIKDLVGKNPIYFYLKSNFLDVTTKDTIGFTRLIKLDVNWENYNAKHVTIEDDELVSRIKKEKQLYFKKLK